MRFIIFFVFFCLIGCATKPVSTITPPSSGVVAAHNSKASSSVKNAATAVNSAADIVARITATGSVPNDVRILQLRADLTKAQIELSLAKAELDLSAQEILKLQTRIDNMAKESNKVVDRLNYIEPKYATSVGIIWRWRLLAIGTWVVVAGFFVARQYFPILKLI